MKIKSLNTVLIIVLIGLLVAIASLSYAWFKNEQALSTLITIIPPDSITIMPVSEKDGSFVKSLDLDYREDSNDIKDEDGTIHILRPVCIRSTSKKHQLEIVHTTNLGSLMFKIYPAEKNDDSFVFDKDVYLSGKYKNKNGEIAVTDPLENYMDGDNVEDHAYPLYWLAVECGTSDVAQEGWQSVTSYTERDFDPATKQEKDFYFTYYYLEISWKETGKETDLFYIIAQNIA